MVRKDTEIKFRVDSQTRDLAQKKAERLDVPLSQICRQLLREWIAQDDTLPRGVPIDQIVTE
jgi:antitoxin component of RelBE/YafQ-DinJ toxin-antitoxin module